MSITVIKRAGHFHQGKSQYVQEIANLLEEVIQKMVDDAFSVKVLAIENEKTVVFKVECPHECLGQILGSGGKNINAVRTVALAMSARRGVRCIVEIPYASKKL